MSDEGLSHALDTLSIRADIPAAKQVRGKSEGDIPSTYTSTRLDPPSALYPFSFVNGNDKSSNPSHFPNLLLNESVSDANEPLYPQNDPVTQALAVCLWRQERRAYQVTAFSALLDS